MKEGDETHTIEVRATATNDNGVTISGRCQVKQPQREIEQGLTSDPLLALLYRRYTPRK